MNERVSDENAFLFFWGGGKGEMKFLNFFFEFFGLARAVAVSVCMYVPTLVRNLSNQHAYGTFKRPIRIQRQRST